MLFNPLVQKIKKALQSPVPYFIIRLALGSIFIYAGFIKLLDPKAFAKAISLYYILPDVLLAPVAIGLPIIELLAGLGLIFNIRGSLAVISALLLCFTAVLGYGIFNNLNIDCGCFSSEEIREQNSLKTAFYRDLIMMGGIFFLFLSKRWFGRTVNARHSTEQN